MSSPTINQHFRTEWDNEVIAKFQAKGTGLESMIRRKTAANADDFYFLLLDQIQAMDRIDGTPVPHSDAQHSRVNVTKGDYHVPHWLGRFDLDRLGSDERAALQNAIRWAATRKKDQIIIDELNATTGLTTVAGTVFDAGNKPTLEQVKRMMRILDEREVPDGDEIPGMERILLHSPAFLEDLLDDTRISSSDYNNVQALREGKVKKYLRFRWVSIGKRKEGGLPLAGGVRTGWALGGEAAGFLLGGLNQTSVEMDYHSEFTSWLMNLLFVAGAKVLQPDGVIEYSHAETSV